MPYRKVVVIARYEKDFDRRVKAEAESLMRGREDGGKNWGALVAALGEDPERFYDNASVLAAVVAVRKAGVANTWAGLRNLLSAVEAFTPRLRAAIGEMAIPDKAAD